VQITEHFTWEEAMCRCGCKMPADVAHEVVATAQFMERVREALGAQPVFVASWYRCAVYNAQIGGAADSQHLLGKAVDFSIKWKSPTSIQSALLSRPGATEHELIWRLGGRGIECDPGHTHVDRRAGDELVKFYP
jgi:uncharacterized protein YcbK (DUF882 family)